MTEEEKERERIKRLYRGLRSGMISINNELDETIDAQNALLSEIKQGLLVDGDAYLYEDLSRNFDVVNDIKNEVSNSVIPSINNKI